MSVDEKVYTGTSKKAHTQQKMKELSAHTNSSCAQHLGYVLPTLLNIPLYHIMMDELPSHHGRPHQEIDSLRRQQGPSPKGASWYGEPHREEAGAGHPFLWCEFPDLEEQGTYCIHGMPIPGSYDLPSKHNQEASCKNGHTCQG